MSQRTSFQSGKTARRSNPGTVPSSMEADLSKLKANNAPCVGVTGDVGQAVARLTSIVETQQNIFRELSGRLAPILKQGHLFGRGESSDDSGDQGPVMFSELAGVLFDLANQYQATNEAMVELTQQIDL